MSCREGRSDFIPLRTRIYRAILPEYATLVRIRRALFPKRWILARAYGANRRAALLRWFRHTRLARLLRRLGCVAVLLRGPKYPVGFTFPLHKHFAELAGAEFCWERGVWMYRLRYNVGVRYTESTIERLIEIYAARMRGTWDMGTGDTTVIIDLKTAGDK